MGLKWFLVHALAQDDCGDHDRIYLVAAKSEEEAVRACGFGPFRGWEHGTDYYGVEGVEELILPKLNRRKKSFIWR